MPSAWVEHIREYAKQHNMSYACAMTQPDCKSSYHAKRPPKLTKKEKKEVESMGAEEDTGRINKINKHKEKVMKMKAKLMTGISAKETAEKAREKAEQLQMGAEDIKPKPKKKRPPLIIESDSEEEYILPPKKKDNITMTITEKKKRGRKPKYANEEERKKAKREQTLASNKKKRAEKKESKLEKKRQLVIESDSEGEGNGLVIGYQKSQAEAPNGLAHIYELTPANIIRMTRHLI